MNDVTTEMTASLADLVGPQQAVSATRDLAACARRACEPLHLEKAAHSGSRRAASALREASGLDRTLMSEIVCAFEVMVSAHYQA